MTLNIGEKIYTIKYGYMPTLKSHLISKTVKAEKQAEEIQNGNFEALEDFLMFISEMLLVGLQKFHQDEFGYDIDTGAGIENQLKKISDLIDTFSSDGGDIRELFANMQEEMVKNSFLKKLFQEEHVKVQNTEIQTVNTEQLKTTIAENPQITLKEN